MLHPSVDVMRRSSHIKEKRREYTENLTYKPSFDNLGVDIKNFLQHFSLLHKDLENKAVLFPETEKTVLNKLIETEVLFYKLMKHVEK